MTGSNCLRQRDIGHEYFNLWIKLIRLVPCSTELHILVDMTQGDCIGICPLSWSVHCNFVRDGKFW
jgi:hypothetical protein